VIGFISYNGGATEVVQGQVRLFSNTMDFTFVTISADFGNFVVRVSVMPIDQVQVVLVIISVAKLLRAYL
jgi:hypothetical protein